MSTRSVLVAGCGFLGVEVARQFQKSGWQVLGLTHSTETATKLITEPFPAVACDIADSAAVGALAAARGPFDLVVHCASSGRGEAADYRRVYLEGARNLLEHAAPSFLIFTSSTSVYPQLDGSRVTEESPADPTRETGRILRETEELVIGGGGAVLRLSALYGAGRSVLLRKFFQGEAVIEGDGHRWINQIHRDDAASAILRLGEEKAPGLFNVTDDTPLSQLEVYQWLSHRFGRPLPPRGESNPNRKRGLSSKRVSNSRMRSLGWAPTFPSFFTAVAHDPTLAEGCWTGL